MKKRADRDLLQMIVSFMTSKPKAGLNIGLPVTCSTFWVMTSGETLLRWYPGPEWPVKSVAMRSRTILLTSAKWLIRALAVSGKLTT